MVIKIKMKSDTFTIPLDWRRTVLSYIKSILQEEYVELYEEFYGKGQTKMKPFTFWAFFAGAKFKKDCIELEQKEFTLFFSTNNTKLAFYIYNGLQKRKGTSYPMGEKNWMMPLMIRIIEEKEVRDEEIIINMLSPLVIRYHEKDKNDRYILPQEEGFESTFLTCISKQVSMKEHDIKIETIKVKKVIVKAFGTNIPSSLGIFKLSGNIKAINELYENGMGARSSAGFGKFEVIG